MIVLSNEQLQQLLPSFPEYYPKSLQLEVMVQNRLNGRWCWPGTEFVVDKFPDYSLLMCRPIKDSPEYIPWPATYTVSIFCKSLDSLEVTVRSDDFVDWKQTVMFYDIATDCFLIIRKRCEELGGPDPGWSENMSRGIIHLLRLSDLVKSELPGGFHLGEITEAHAEQINREWKYGSPASLSFFRYIIRQKFPSSGVFTEDGRLVAYILYRSDGMMFNGFVHPDFRRLGLFQVVNYDAVEKITKGGQSVSFVAIMPWN